MKGDSMKVARPILIAAAVGVVLALVFAVFAVELASGESRSRNQIRTEVQDRAVLTGSLIDSVFGSVQAQKVQYQSEFGGQVDRSKLETTAESQSYAVVTDATGTVIAASSGYHAASGLAVAPSTLSNLAQEKAVYFLSDFVPYGSSYIADFVVPFPTPGGERLLITGLNPTALTPFFGSELRSVPGVKGEANYLIDGQGHVVASSDSKTPLGTTLTHPTATSLRHRSGEDHGSFFQQASLSNSNWKVLLVAPDAALFASVNGAGEYVPWVIFAALVLVALVAAFLGFRVIRSAEVVTEVNSKLASVNAELSVANDSLHRRAAELARSNEELDSFASIASHDLQEPLRKVRTFTQQLTVLEADRLSEKGRDYLGRANASAERMQRLIEDLLKFSRVSTQGHPFEQVNLAEVAERVLDDLESQIEESGAHVEVGNLPVITADPLQMHQLLQNLISNALKFRRPDVAPAVRVDATVLDGNVQLVVSDNGIGFEPRYAARIFRIFERLHGRTEYPGTGIGLSLCRKIADRHGGTIEAESELGSGATFIVTLPVNQSGDSFGVVSNTPHFEETGYRARV
jgi:signal transduction histidine kinase